MVIADFLSKYDDGSFLEKVLPTNSFRHFICGKIVRDQRTYFRSKRSMTK